MLTPATIPDDVSPDVHAARRAAAIQTDDRRAGIDVNVSNVTIASHEGGRDLHVTRVARDGQAKARSRKRARQQHRQLRALERSRRAMNRDQYQLSRRQEKRARRRAAAGLRSVGVIPAGPRKARSDGKPLQAFRKDTLSNGYRRQRAARAATAASTTQAHRDHARQIARGVVREHGFRIVVEDTDLRTWARRWGRALAAFSPGTLLTAIEREARAVARVGGVIVGAGVARAATRTTALSQHCLCGARVAKSLAQRVHDCPACGLRGDRDAVSATLGACVVLATAGAPASAYVDPDLAQRLRYDVRTHDVLRDTLASSIQGRQDVPSESTAHSARDGYAIVEPGRTPDYVGWLGELLARRHVQPRMSLATRQTTPDRASMRTNLSGYGFEDSTPLRDSS